MIHFFGGENTKNTIISGLKQFSITRFIIGVTTIVVVLAFSSLETLLRLFPVSSALPANYHLSLLLSALGSDTTASFIPIISVLPFSSSYIDDIKNSFIRYVYIRSGKTPYLLSRIIVCFLTGGMVIATGILITAGISTVLFIPIEEQVSELSPNLTPTLFQAVYLFFLLGGFWSVVGMAMSTLMESKYISYATPFVFYYLLVILYERYFSDLFILYPKTWTDPTAWPFGCWGATIFLLEMTLIFAFLFAFRAGRRLQQL